eukprot:COSAG04_NODE_3840_length_2483_cov_2.932466_2_plen_143_part_00
MLRAAARKRTAPRRGQSLATLPGSVPPSIPPPRRAPGLANAHEPLLFPDRSTSEFWPTRFANSPGDGSARGPVLELMLRQAAYALELRKLCASCTCAPGMTSRATHRPQRSSKFSLRPRADRRRWPCRRKVAGSTPRAHLRA